MHREEPHGNVYSGSKASEECDEFGGASTWKTEEDAFVMDGYHGHEKGGESVMDERLRAMGTQRVFRSQPSDFKDGKIVGTKRCVA